MSDKTADVQTIGTASGAVLARCIIDAALYAYGSDAWRGNGQTTPADRIRAREIVSALDALQTAVKPVRDAYDCSFDGTDYQPRTVDVDTLELRALLDCISTLLGASHER